MVHVCETCSGTHFQTIEGYFYCLECGTQSINQQVEMESEAVMIGDRTIGGDVITLQKDTKDDTDSRITSWEEYNYILVGLTDEMLSLGANYRFKKVVLKLWARYLQINEAAFFSLHDECLPKLPANFQKRDAEILYNKHHRRRKRRRASCSSVETVESKTSTAKADSVIKSFTISKILKKTKAELARAQYEDYKKFDDDSSSLASSLATSSQHSSDAQSKVSLKLEFTRNARRMLKREMPKKHIQKHESDYEDALDCHKGRVVPRAEDKIESLSNTVLIAIIYLALNLTEDAIQWSDLIRYLREGHLSYFNIQHFLPENIKQESHSNFEMLLKKSIFYHSSMRLITAKLCRDMSIMELIRPNLTHLVHRYVDDLLLPVELKVILEKFIAFKPPEMEYNAATRDKLRMLPNYEGRAMAYIIFILKLLFGMDDERETKISDSARRINELIPDCPSLHLFVVEDWLRMLKVRRAIVEKFHMPSAVRRPWDEKDSTRAPANAQNYAEHIKSMYANKIPTERQKRSHSNAAAVANNTFQLLAGVNERNQELLMRSDDNEGEGRIVEKSFNFSASMTPSRDYTKVLLEEHSKFHPILSATTEECLRQDFALTSVQAFYGDRTSTDQLKKAILKTRSTTFGVTQLSLSSRKLNVVQANRHHVDSERLRHKVKVEFVPKEIAAKLVKGFKFTKEMEEKKKKATKRVCKINFADEQPLPEAETDDLTLYTSNMDYWIQFSTYTTVDKPFRTEGYTEMIDSLPNNFKFLVLELARVIEQDPRFLFLELAVLEQVLVYGIDGGKSKIKKDGGPMFTEVLW